CITSDFTIVKVTNINFITNNTNIVQSIQISSSSGALDNHLDIDLIVKDIDLSTS
ncbi:32187_t:CDS:1, partial [Gigaspora margarita]